MDPQVIQGEYLLVARLIRPPNTLWHILRARSGEEDKEPGGFGSLVNAETVGSKSGMLVGFASTAHDMEFL
jgi:hypothetical protein